MFPSVMMLREVLTRANRVLRKQLMEIFKTIDMKMLDSCCPGPGLLEEEVTVGKFYATFLIQDYFRRFKKKKDYDDMVPGFGDDTRPLQAGLRTLHEAGPELKRAISGELSDNAEEMPFISGAIRGALRSPSTGPSPQHHQPKAPLPVQRMATAPPAPGGSPELSVSPVERSAASPSSPSRGNIPNGAA